MILTFYTWTFTMPWRGKRKRFPSSKARSLKRRRVGPKSSFRRSSKKKTWSRKRTSRKSMFRRKKVTVRRIWSKLSSLPTPAKCLWVDQLSNLCRNTGTGLEVTTGLAHMAGALSNAPKTTTGGLTPLFTSSPLDIGLLFGAAYTSIASGQVSGVIGPLGLSSFHLLGYEHTQTFNNPGSMPCTVTRHTIVCHNDVPGQMSVGDLTDGSANPGYFTFDVLMSHLGVSEMNQGTTTIGSNLLPLTSINPWQTATAANSAQTAVTMPGFRLTDIPSFNRYFRFRGRRTKVLQPGQSVTWRVKSRKRRTFDTSKYLDTYAASPTATSLLATARYLAFRGSVHYIYTLHGTQGTSTGGGSNNTTTGQAIVSSIQTYRYQCVYAASNTNQFTGSASHLASGVTVQGNVPFTSTQAAYVSAT